VPVQKLVNQTSTETVEVNQLVKLYGQARSGWRPCGLVDFHSFGGSWVFATLQSDPLDQEPYSSFIN
jgi:hypothetical protein